MTREMVWIALLLWTSLVCGQSRKQVIVEGHVKDYLSQPVAGAEVALVVLTGDGFFQPKAMQILKTVPETDQEGTFRFETATTAGNHHFVVARKRGLAIGWEYLDTILPQNTLEVILERALEFDGFSGQLIDAWGRPVEGAIVQACPILRARWSMLVSGPRSWFRAETDTKGVFRFTQLPSEYPVSFYVSTPGRTIHLQYPPRRGMGNDTGGYQVDGRDVVLTLPETATVNVKIVDQATGESISGIRLMLRPEDSKTGLWRFLEHAAVSDANGSFQITGVPPGRHELRFIHRDSGPTHWVGGNTLVSIPPSVHDQQVVLHVVRGVPLEIQTREAQTGHALPRMKVYIGPIERPAPDQDPGFVQSTHTGHQGSVRLFVPPGQHRIQAWGDNFQGSEEGVIVNVTRDREPAVSISLHPAKPLIRGTVIDEQGHPVAGVTVQVEHSLQKVTTNSQGQFAVQQNPLYTPRQVTAWDTRNNRTGICTHPMTERAIQIKLKPCLTITGRILDGSGQGISTAKVWLHLAYHGRTPESQRRIDLAWGSTDLNGNYELNQVLPLQGPYRHYQYGLSADAVGYGPSAQTFRRFGQAGDSLIAPDMQLVAVDGAISGVLLDRNGQPMACQGVVAFSDTGNNRVTRSTNTDEKGRFVINRIAQGPVKLHAQNPSGQLYTRLNAHSGDHVLFTVSGGEHTFRPVTSRVGSPLPDLGELEIAFDPQQFKNKPALVCLVDITQRPTQCSLSFLNNIQGFLRRKGVSLVCIQVAPIDEETLIAWKRENGINLPIEILPGNAEALQEAWGVRSLPWLTLTDRDHIITEEGFQTGRTGLLIKDNVDSVIPLNRNRETRGRR